MIGWLTGAVLLLVQGETQAVKPPAAVQPSVTVVVAPGVTGRLERHAQFASRHVDPRNVDVWLPPGHAEGDARRFPVVYMHDGQNLFDPAVAYAGIDWGIDETMTRLIGAGAIREAIVVGVWNTPKRFAEYMPRKAFSDQKPFVLTTSMEELRREHVLSDDYLKFLVTELKPFIDATYRTLPERASTTIMGSSMGGLIALYALAEYPDIFGGAGGVSTHWLIGEGIVIDYLEKHLPEPRGHRVYFDFGTATLDQYYEPYQRRMDAVMRRAGYREGEDWITRKYEGAEHNETAWKARVDVPLTFFLRR
jgi:predicted alpha/beta superfamily hydrolase